MSFWQFEWSEAIEEKISDELNRRKYKLNDLNLTIKTSVNT